MTEECWNHGYVMIVLNNALLSSIRFWKTKVVSIGRPKDEVYTQHKYDKYMIIQYLSSPRYQTRRGSDRILTKPPRK